MALQPRSTYAHALELGCSKGNLAQRLAIRCAWYTQYIGLDAMEAPLAAAGLALAHGQFVPDHLPTSLPRGDYDLIVLSEILCLLDAGDLDALADELDVRWPSADIICVTSRRASSSDTPNGEAALTVFVAATEGRSVTTLRHEAGYRIDLLSPVGEPPAGARANRLAAE